MTLRLSVRTNEWRARVDAAAAELPGLIPVVKGNGYGFGRAALMPVAASLGSHIAVGTVFEAGDVPPDRRAVVLTPHADQHLNLNVPAGTILTVSTVDHVDVLRAAGWSGDVIVKLRSSMHRYGATAEELRPLLSAIVVAGLQPVGYALHLPLAAAAPVEEIGAWLARLDPALPLAVSHIDPVSYAWLRETHPRAVLQIRAGTSLWHADKSLLHLTATVVDAHPVRRDAKVGYRGSTVPADGTLVLVAAGSAHGVQPLEGGLSPFHFARQRLALVEPPHMHTSMVVVPAGSPCPSIGDRVDVQRPLISVHADEVEWL